MDQGQPKRHTDIDDPKILGEGTSRREIHEGKPFLYSSPFHTLKRWNAT